MSTEQSVCDVNVGGCNDARREKTHLKFEFVVFRQAGMINSSHTLDNRGRIGRIEIFNDLQEFPM